MTGTPKGMAIAVFLTLTVTFSTVHACSRQADCPEKQMSIDLNFVPESGIKDENVTDDKVWLFAVDGRQKPYSFLDDRGQLIGFDVDLVSKVCQLASKTCQIVLAEFTECAISPRDINLAGRGLMAEWFDGCLRYTVSIDRLAAFDFTDPYLETVSSFTVLPGNPSNFDPKLADYSNFTIVHLTGAGTNGKCLGRLGKKFGKIIIAQNLPDAKNILTSRKADVLFSPRTVIPDLVVLPDRFHCEKGGAGVMTKKGSALSSWWNPAYASLVSSGQFKQFCREASVTYQATFKCLNVTDQETHPAPYNAPEAEKTWLFGVSGRRKPFNFLDDQGNMLGFDLDFIQAICQLAGKKCETVLIEFKECSFSNRNINYPGRGLMDGWFDACPGYVNSLDRHSGFEFTDAYLKTYATFSVIPGNPSGFNPNLTDYSNFTFTHLNGAYNNAACLKRLGKTAKNIVIAENLPNAKEILFNRTADVLFSPRAVIPDLVTFPERAHCELTGTSVMVKKGSPLPEWWNKAYELYVKQGGYNKLCVDSIAKYNFPIKCFE